MKQKSLIVNVMYNALYTGLNLLFPLMTAPYLSKVLGASNLGKVYFATVIVNWFILFATFGTATFGIREVAKVRDNKEQLNKLFSEIFIINGVMSIIITLIYYITILTVNGFSKEFPLYLIFSLSIILNIFNIDWFYQGIEEYRYITIRSALFKILSLFSIFLFVKQKEHYILYGLISIIAISLSGIMNYLYSKKYVKLKFSGTNPLQHLKSLRIFFLHTFVVNIYTNADQTLLGFLIDTKSVAFMNRAKIVVGMAISLSTAVSNVMLPRASYYIKNDTIKFRKLLSEVPNYILWITTPITAGCICLAPNIMYILGGKEFMGATLLLQIISVTIICSPLSSYLQYQVLVASGNEKLGLYCALVTSILSLLLNILLIPVVGLLAAGIVQIISEASAVSMRYYIAKKKLNYTEVKFLSKSSIYYLIASLLMSGVVISTNNIINNLVLSFFIGSISGGIIYIIVLVLLKEKVMISVLKKLKAQVVNKLSSAA